MNDTRLLKDKLSLLDDDQKTALLKKLDAKKHQSKMFDLAPIQELFYFHHQFQPTLCNVPVAITIRGPLDRQTLQKVLNQIVVRHEALRTAIVEQPIGVKQKVNVNVMMPFEFIDLMAVATESKELEARQLMGSFFYRPFYFHEDSLVRSLLMKLETDHYILAVSIHHIVMDGWSLGIIINDLIKLYEREKGHLQTTALPILNKHYSDYVAWLQRDQQRQLMVKNLNYWRETLKDANTILQLPTDYQRPTIRQGFGDTKTYPLSLELSKQIRTFARDAKSTLFMFFLSCFAIFINRYTRETDMLIGSPVSVRDMDFSEQIVGVFLNFLVFRIKLCTENNFQQLLMSVKEVALGAYQHQQCPFSEILKVVKPKNEPSFNSLFQVFLAHNNAPIKTHTCADLALTPILEEAGGADADLALFYSDAQEQLILRIEYSTELFKASSIDAMFQQLEHLISEILQDDRKPIYDYNFLNTQNLAQLLKFGNYHECKADTKTILHLLNTVIESNPDVEALVDDQFKLCYHQLPCAVYQVIHQFSLAQWQPGDNVLVLVDNSCTLVLIILALFELGLRYVPIDRCVTYDNLLTIIDDAKPALIISDRDEQTVAIPIILLRETPVDLDLQQMSPVKFSNINSNSVAYLIYTSGSTGQPKASLNTHQSLYALMSWWQTIPSQHRGRSITTLAPSFDVSLHEILGSLVLANTLYCITQKKRNDINLLTAEIIQYKITVLSTVPQILQLLLERTDFRQHNKIETVVAAGDVLTKNLVQTFYQIIKGKLYNGFGPSEAGIFVTAHETQCALLSQTVPIGRPIAQRQVFILSEKNNFQPINVPGELCIAGIGLATGYLNRPELTSEKFVPSPWHDHSKLYRTGDLARWLPDGSIEFLGRIDKQIKFNGIRVELEAIETAITKFSGISQAVVVLREDNNNDRRLHAFITQHTPVDLSELRAFLMQHLSHSVIPNFFHQLSAVPTNTSGKVDRKLLTTQGLPEILNRFKQQLSKSISSSELFFFEQWQEINYISGSTLSNNCLLVKNKHFELEPSLFDSSNLKIIDIEDWSSTVNQETYICLNHLSLDEAQQQFFSLKNKILENKPDIINIVLPQSKYQGLFIGLVKTLSVESNINYRVITTDSLNQKTLLTISCLDINHIYNMTETTLQQHSIKAHAIPEFVSGAAILRKQGTYVISGGLGGIGLSLASFIASTVKCNLILVSRNLAVSLQQQTMINELKKLGSTVELCSIDITKQAEVDQLVKVVKEKYGTVNGIIHAAGHVDFGVIAKKTNQEITDILAPKVFGLNNLYEAFQEQDYQFFIACSSTITANPAAGVGSYIIANETLDSFVNTIYSSDKRIKAIKWGMWRDVGMSTPDKISSPSPEYFAHYDNFAVTPKEAVSAFEQTLALATPIIYITKESLKLNEPSVMVSFKDAIPVSASINQIKQIWETTLNQPNIDINSNFFEVGGHSLLALQLVNRIAEQLNIKVKLQDVFAYPTIKSFVEHLM